MKCLQHELFCLVLDISENLMERMSTGIDARHKPASHPHVSCPLTAHQLCLTQPSILPFDPLYSKNESGMPNNIHLQETAGHHLHCSYIYRTRGDFSERREPCHVTSDLLWGAIAVLLVLAKRLALGLITHTFIKPYFLQICVRNLITNVGQHLNAMQTQHV